MPSKVLAGVEVEVDAEGFLVNPNAWSEEIAGALAAEAGIAELSEEQWRVIRFMREQYLELGVAP